MSKRSAIDKALEKVDGDIAILQAVRLRLAEQQGKPALRIKKPRLRVSNGDEA